MLDDSTPLDRAPAERPPPEDAAGPVAPHPRVARAVEMSLEPLVVRAHPLDRPGIESRQTRDENQRIRLAWARLVWLLSFLAVLVAISYLVPYMAEQTQY